MELSMTRFRDFAFGVLLGAVGAGAIVALADSPTLDPVKLSPQYYKVRLDNAQVRVLEFHLKPGEKEVMHSHPQGVVFVLADAVVKNTFPDGSATTRHVKQGDVEWSNAVTHTGENVGTSEAHYYRVELKSTPN
jgi:quercetin dioxygenase-like cupin family protein